MVREQGQEGGQVALDEALVCQHILAGWGDTEGCWGWQEVSKWLEWGGRGYERSLIYYLDKLRF